MGIKENNMETTIMDYIGLRIYSFKKLGLTEQQPRKASLVSATSKYCLVHLY